MTDKEKEAAAWFLECFEINGYVDITKGGKIDVHGSCRLRQGVCRDKKELAYPFRIGNRKFLFAIYSPDFSREYS